MPVYRDDKTNTFRVQFKEKDIKGNLKCIHKRGFKTKKEAVAWETEYRSVKSGSVRTSFEKFVNEIYVPQMGPRLKPSTWNTKMSMIEKFILPFLGSKRLNEIEANDIIKWQNQMLRMKNPETGKTYAKSYLKTINNQLTAIFSFATKFYKLPSNPAKVVGNMGTDDEITTVCWDLEQYKKFREFMMDKPVYFYLFEVLYWCGLRIGEAQALTFKDIDFKKKLIEVNKTYYRLKGQDCVGTPKTKQSYRTVIMPDFLADELKEYKNMVYKPDDSNRIFNLSKSAITRALKSGAKKAGLPECRVHDLRHASASLLLEEGYSIPAIATRLGHSPNNVAITYRYTHVKPTKQEDIASTLNLLAKKKDDCEES